VCATKYGSGCGSGHRGCRRVDQFPRACDRRRARLATTRKPRRRVRGWRRESMTAARPGSCPIQTSRPIPAGTTSRGRARVRSAVARSISALRWAIISDRVQTSRGRVQRQRRVFPPPRVVQLDDQLVVDHQECRGWGTSSSRFTGSSTRRPNTLVTIRCGCFRPPLGRAMARDVRDKPTIAGKIALVMIPRGLSRGVCREVEASDLDELRSRLGSGWLIWRLRCRIVYGCGRRTSSSDDATALSR
jgi:hypothetical protein